jgi:oxygen-independent coproporphyrinogen-3 oxidase
MTEAELSELITALGDAPRVSYAPPNIYPMSAPVFDPVEDAGRGEQPDGPLGIYAHAPFCNYHCTFCFYSTLLAPTHQSMERYVAGVERELSWVRPGTELLQLYVGGGTPTVLPPDLLDRLLTAIFSRVSPGKEVNTVECSPESVTSAHVDVLKRHGIERVSMGVQSTDEDVRQRIFRRHDNRQILDAVDLLVASGLVVNIDLIYGLPGQDEAGFRADFAMVAGRGVHGVTSYNLRVNEKTAVGRLLTDSERLTSARLVRWRELVRDVGAEHGFHQTRWHTLKRTRPDTAAEATARFRDVTGWGNQYSVGMSARSRLEDVIYRNHKSIDGWLERVEAGRSPVEELKQLDEFERQLRYVTLTLGDGNRLERDGFERTFGRQIEDQFGEPIARLVGAGVIEDDGRGLQLSDRGRLVHDLATRAFYPDHVRRWMDERQRLADTAVNLRST